MTCWALIVNGVCHEFTHVDPTGRYNAELRWVVVDDLLAVYVDSAYVERGGIVCPPSIDYLREQIAGRVAGQRWLTETAGITLQDGTRIATGIDDQNRISAALAGMERYGLDKVDFKATTGWVSLSYEQLKAIGGAVVAHVQAAFTAERVHAEALKRLDSVDALLAYNWQAGWPG